MIYIVYIAIFLYDKPVLPSKLAQVVDNSNFYLGNENFAS